MKFNFQFFLLLIAAVNLSSYAASAPAQLEMDRLKGGLASAADARFDACLYGSGMCVIGLLYAGNDSSKSIGCCAAGALSCCGSCYHSFRAAKLNAKLNQLSSKKNE